MSALPLPPSPSLLLLSFFLRVPVSRRTATVIMCRLSHERVSSVWRAGPRLQSCGFSVPRRTAAAILWGECRVPDPNWWSCEISVARRTSNANLWVPCGVPDLNRDRVSSVWGAGLQLDMSERMSIDMSEDVWERMSVHRYVRKSVSRSCENHGGDPSK